MQTNAPSERPALPAEPPSVLAPIVGWREWVAVPGLGIGAIRAKLDSGARSSSLHVESIATCIERGALVVEFQVRLRRNGRRVLACRAPAIDRRCVTDSGGHRDERWFVLVETELAGRRFEMEMNLTDRGAMLFPLLLGRTALAGRFRIDPALSYTYPRPSQAATTSQRTPA